VPEESEEEPEVATDAVPEVVWWKAPAEGAMITVHTMAAPPIAWCTSTIFIGTPHDHRLGHRN
jgi:hypothetical protein